MISAMPTPYRWVPPRQQHGVVLVIVLIFLLALSTIAIFAARNFTLGERQARNDLEYQVARQAAESALRDAERDLRLSATATPTGAICTRGDSVLRTEDPVISDAEFTASCLKGQCNAPTAQYTTGWSAATTTNKGEPWWPTSKGGAWSDYFATLSPNTTTAPSCTNFVGGVPLGLFTGTAPMAGVARQPEYLIEYINPKQDTGAETKGFDCPTEIAGSPGLASADSTTAAAASQSLNMPCHMFRITSRGFGPTLNTQLVMQTYFHIIKY